MSERPVYATKEEHEAALIAINKEAHGIGVQSRTKSAAWAREAMDELMARHPGSWVAPTEPVDGSIHDRLMTMDVPRIADELHTAIVDARSHPLIPIIEEYMRELAQVAYEAGAMQAGFDDAFDQVLKDSLAHGVGVMRDGKRIDPEEYLDMPKGIMPEIADRDCSFIERDGDVK